MPVEHVARVRDRPPGGRRGNRCGERKRDAPEAAAGRDESEASDQMGDDESDHGEVLPGRERGSGERGVGER